MTCPIKRTAKKAPRPKIEKLNARKRLLLLLQSSLQFFKRRNLRDNRHALPGRKGAAMSKHLTLSERVLIERYISDSYSFAFIAKRLARSPSTIAREVKRHRCFTGDHRYDDVNDCLDYRRCLRRNLCDTETRYSCFGRCKTCTEYDCRALCGQYVSKHCPLLDKPPYICAGCEKEKSCKRDHAYYSALKRTWHI